LVLHKKENVDMNRVVKFLTVAALMVAVTSSAFAQTANQRLEGTTGVGYFNSVAPVGVRHWVNDGMAVDVGVGVDYKNNQVAPSTATTSLFDYALDVGVPVVMHGEENMIVYFRPGVTLSGVQGFTGTADDKGYDTNVRGEVALGGEFFLGQFGWPNLSLSGQVGVGVDWMKSRVDGADSSVQFSTSTTGVDITRSGNMGFRLYF
jgi:hypothetical protein